MCAELNPGTAEIGLDTYQKQTVEIRSADGSADIYLLMASLAVALRYGIELENGLQVAADTYVDVNIHNAENAKILERLEQLPVNCSESADCLEKVRGIFEDRGVFESNMIDGVIKKLKSYDQNEADEAMHDEVKMMRLVTRYFHCG
jgi:glutamine synthetase